MSSAERLTQLNNAALSLINQCETGVGELVQQVEQLSAQLDIERRRLMAALDELRVLSYLTPQSESEKKLAKGLNLEAFQQSQRELEAQLLACGALAAKLNGLTNLFTISRGQFAPQDETSGDLDVWKLVERVAMIKAQELERSRLAREVHDGPAQVLANAILGIELCQQLARRSPERLDDELNRLKGNLREGLVEVRRFQFDLRPASLADRGLLATLQRYTDEYRQFFKIDVVLQLPTTFPTLTQDEELQVFRIVQEALQNIQKHARATTVVVQLDANGEQILASIQDNGRGFLQQQVEATTLSGAGIRGMGERAATVGGELTVESAPGAGTTVRLKLPRSTGEGDQGHE